MAPGDQLVKFDEKYPDKKNPQKLWPDRLMGPHPEVWVNDALVQTWRMYPCSICKAYTGWREMSQGVPITLCSEECLQALVQRMIESAKEAHEPEAPDAMPEMRRIS